MNSSERHLATTAPLTSTPTRYKQAAEPSPSETLFFCNLYATAIGKGYICVCNLEMSVSRPPNLPSFASPPLREVGVSIQHERAEKYYDLYANYVYEALKSEYPQIEEHEAIAQSYETFSDINRTFGKQVKFELAQGVMNNRYFFISNDDEYLIQYQNDRIGLNWRKQEGKEYPRFEKLFDQFQSVIRKIDSLHQEKGWGDLCPSQCEVLYVNVIQIDDALRTLPVNIFSGSAIGSLEAFQTNAVSRVLDESGDPVARLYVNAKVQAPSGNPEIRLQLTFRGPPKASDLDSAYALLLSGRESIVNTFTDITTQDAHNEWLREQ
jgi:uncharacterized protein (TIGR04255 family)